MNITLRKAKADELRLIQDLNHALFEADHANDPLLNMNWPYEEGEDYFRRIIAGEIGVCFVAEVNDEVVGYLAGCIKLDNPSYRPVKRSELENMFVKENHRGQGVGKKLVQEFLNWSQENGMEKCLVSAYAPNENAIGFYRKMGFLPYAVDLEVTL